jgi:hypothetical protein
MERGIGAAEPATETALHNGDPGSGTETGTDENGRPSAGAPSFTVLRRIAA